jgi:hypothetical protein
LLIVQFFPPSLPALGTLWIVTHAEDLLTAPDEIADPKLLLALGVNACGVVPAARLLRHASSLSAGRDDLPDRQ